MSGNHPLQPVIGGTSMDTNPQINAGTSGNSLALPKTICFPVTVSSSIALGAPAQMSDSTRPGSSAQLNTVALGPVFNVNASQILQQIPLSVSQQQTLTVALNQQQQSMANSISQAACQASQNTISVVSQPQQLVSSTLAGQGLSFVNPTLFTIPGASNQGQFLTTPFAQLPIVLSNQQGIFSTINTAQALDPANSQIGEANILPVPQAVLHVGQPPPVVLTSSSSNSNGMNGSGFQTVSTTTNPNSKSTDELASLSSQPVSVYSMPSTTMSVITVSKSDVKCRQTSPDTTSPGQINQIGMRRSNEKETCFNPITSSSVLNSKDLTEKGNKSKFMNESTFSEFSRISSCSRMKYTPVDAQAPKTVIRNSANEGNDHKITTTTDHQDKGKDTQHLQVKTDEQQTSDDSTIASSSCLDQIFDDNKGQEPKYPLCVKTEKSEDPHGSLADVEDLEEQDFVWEDYLKETGAASVLPTAFKHVELSLQSGFVKGMKLEAPSRSSSDTYWIASIVMTCGPLLRLRYEGYEDNSSADFWSDPMTSDIHPLGWCEEHGKTFLPPEVIEEKYPDWKAFLTKRLLTATKAPAYLLDKSTGAIPVDQIREGMRLEIQETVQCDHVWVVRVVENVGGRLFLRYHGLETPIHDFWLFYLHERLHPIGWGATKGYNYHAPDAVKQHLKTSEDVLLKSLQVTLEKDVEEKRPPIDIFKEQQTVKFHNFQIGMKLEAVDPVDHNSLGPATVVQVIDSNYFIIEMDTFSEPATSTTAHEKVTKSRQGCHRQTPTILPVGWATRHGIKLRPPQGWEKTFSWDRYLEICKAKAAPDDLFDLPSPEHEFECGMKLEAVNPAQLGQIGAATITQRVGHLLWVHQDSSKCPLDSHAAPASSLDLFPIGWCGSNGYQLQPPAKLPHHEVADSTQKQTRKRAIAIVQPEMADSLKTCDKGDLYNGPQIFFNHRCFSGPYLSKGRIAELPRSVGPGPLTLVMKEVLGMLINTAYKSSRVLRELQLESKPSPNMIQQTLKAKYKGKSYRAVVEICCNVGQLDDFCRQVCLKLQCCPNLISTQFISGECPQHCDQLTKTKYTYYYGKKRRKIGRPPGGHSNLEEGQQRPGGKRRKRKRIGMIHKRSSHTSLEEREENVEDDKESVCSDTRTVDSSSSNNTGSKDQPQEKKPKSFSSEKRGKLARERASLALKRRYTHHIPPPSGIRTRGAKLPKYSFEKRTHKKIMLVDGSQQQHGLKSKKEAIKLMNSLPSKSAFDRERDESGIHSSSSSLPAPVRQGSLMSGASSLPLGLKQEVPLVLDSNPLNWTVTEVTDFLIKTDCGDRDLMARLKTEEIDGQALLLLTLPSIQEFLGVKLGPAIKLCHVIERLKLAFFRQFAG